MNKTFVVKVTAKRGTPISSSRIANAVQMAAPHPTECGWNAECIEVKELDMEELVELRECLAEVLKYLESHGVIEENYKYIGEDIPSVTLHRRVKGLLKKYPSTPLQS